MCAVVLVLLLAVMTVEADILWKHLKKMLKYSQKAYKKGSKGKGKGYSGFLFSEEEASNEAYPPPPYGGYTRTVYVYPEGRPRGYGGEYGDGYGGGYGGGYGSRHPPPSGHYGYGPPPSGGYGYPPPPYQGSYGPPPEAKEESSPERYGHVSAEGSPEYGPRSTPKNDPPSTPEYGPPPTPEYGPPLPNEYGLPPRPVYYPIDPTAVHHAPYPSPYYGYRPSSGKGKGKSKGYKGKGKGKGKGKDKGKGGGDWEGFGEETIGLIEKGFKNALKDL